MSLCRSHIVYVHTYGVGVSERHVLLNVRDKHQYETSLREYSAILVIQWELYLL